MGVAESKLASHPQTLSSSDGITTVTNRILEVEPLLEKLKALEIATPLLKSPPSEVGLKDLLLRHVHNSEHGALDPTTTASLLTLYQEWQRVTSEKINKNQDDLSNKIEVVEALAIKLLQRFNSSLHLMKASATDLENVHAIKEEVKEMKSRFKDVLMRYDALVECINDEGPGFLRAAAKPLTMMDTCNKLE